MADREFDIVLLGATGFAGRLTAAYLAEHAPGHCTWAIAGRSAQKLEAVRAGLGTDVAVVTADVDEERSLRELAGRTRVLATTVGPYVLYGDAVVSACAAAGTDYLDLTGEPEFVDTSYVRYHRTALESGARLVHAAGFDSIPHDLGAWFTVGQLPSDAPISVRGYVRASAAFSGGTAYSALTAFARPGHNRAASKARRELEETSGSRRARATAGRPHRDPTEPGWALPLPTLDPQVVVRTARAAERYGPSFTYGHFASVPSLPLAVGAVGGLAGLAAAVQVPPLRKVVLGRISPGEGPSAEKRARSWFRVTFEGRAGDRRVVTRVSGGDPGYDETAKMLAESALCLAFDDLPEIAGQTTTATAMGDALLGRLTAAGITFEVLEVR